MPTRLSSRLVINAASTYARLAANLLIGIFFTWCMVGQAGLGGFGLVALAGGGLGIAFALETAIDQSLVREMAAALAGADRQRLRRVVASGIAFCALVATGIVLVSGVVALAALAGFFNTPDDDPALAGALAGLFMAEGLIAGATHILMPFTRAIFAAQRVAVDNAVMLGRRLTSPIAAVLAFSVIVPTGELAVQLQVYALLHAALGLAGLVVHAEIARQLVPALRLVRRDFDRSTFRALTEAVRHTVQFTAFTNLTPHLLGLLINLFFGVLFNGMWQIVIQVGGHVRLVAEGVLRGIDTMATHLGEKGRSGQIASLMVHGMRYQLGVALPFAVAYAILLVPVLGLWVGHRLQGDERLAAAGIPVPEALAMVALMGGFNMLAELARAGTRGVERMLYGLGHVRWYAPLAKWGAVLVLLAAGIAMAAAGSPVPAPIALAFVFIAYFDVVILRVASRRGGLPVGRALRGAVPRSVLAAAALGLVALALRRVWPELTILRALVVAMTLGAAHLGLIFFVVLHKAERRRLLQMAGIATG